MISEFQNCYAVIFTSVLKEEFPEGYAEMAIAMEELAKLQPGFLGFESARDQLGISISYWKTMDDIHNWKKQTEHADAQQIGKTQWYKNYQVKICKIERAYSFGAI